MLKLIAKVFGTKSEKDIKKMLPVVDQINEVYGSLATISNDDLRKRSEAVQQKINDDLQSIDDELGGLHQRIADNPDLDISEKEEVFTQVDRLEEKRNEELEKVLKNVLPEAFAIIKDTARRFKENEALEVTATDFDRRLAIEKENVEIKGDKSIWHNQCCIMMCNSLAGLCCTRGPLLKWRPVRVKPW